MKFKNSLNTGMSFIGIFAIVTLQGCGPRVNDSTDDDVTTTNQTIQNQNSTTMEAEKNSTVNKSSQSNELKPKDPKPEWGKGMTDPMAIVIEKLVSFNSPPLTTLTAQQARKEPTPADAVKAVIKDYNIPMPVSKVDTTGKDISVNNGKIHLRMYTPKTGKNNYPVIVYYHGGGWVIAGIDTYSASAQALAEKTDAIVVAVAYRQAPEYKFPTAHEDSYEAYQWVVNNTQSFNGDSKRIAVVGESAGGNLACAVSMMARDNNFQMPVHQVLVYPIAGYDFTTTSYKESDKTKPLNNELMKWFFDKYLTSPSDGKDPKISLVTANLKDLPSTTIIGAEYDPLTTEGKTLADNLKKAGVDTKHKIYNGTTHEFFGMAAVLPQAKDAQEMAVSALKNSLVVRN